ncbi:MAG: ABC transporter ATP-binding protein [Halolamina sp.]|uniref:ABC transporter ATP-binding protein n=1 Tax=Halolamina sp. TaxID=1940283 RepID=UPI002FC39532
MADLALAAVRKEYGDAVALEELTLSVRDGEFFTLVGPSGCGKTTTLRLVAGLEEPTDGVVRLGGEDAAGVPPEDRDVGVVFQSYALFPHMTVRENIRYGLTFSDPPGGVTPDERVDELLDLVNLPGMGDREPDELSGGQQQRIALARALAPAPGVLLLDEPMSALDARLREQLRRQVKQIQDELGVTTLYVTHDQEEALAVSDRLAVMHNGRAEQVGTPQAIYESPETPFVAGFVGENNLFAGVVETRQNGRLVVAVDGAPAGEERVELEAAEGYTPGDRIQFCVRPDALSTDAALNRFTVDIESAEYLGGTARLYGEWADEDVVLRLPEPEVEPVTVGFVPGDATLL